MESVNVALERLPWAAVVAFGTRIPAPRTIDIQPIEAQNRNI